MPVGFANKFINQSWYLDFCGVVVVEAVFSLSPPSSYEKQKIRHWLF